MSDTGYAPRLARAIVSVAVIALGCSATDNVIGTMPGVGGSSSGAADLGDVIAGTAGGAGGGGTTNPGQGVPVGTLGEAGATAIDGISSSSSAGAAGSEIAGSADSECIIRVATTGSDANAGTGFGSALRTVHAGLAAASTLIDAGGCASVEVWVAAGTYLPTAGADRTETFQLVTGVALFGGFVGIESTRAERDIAANVTILSGEIGTSDESDNSYHVVTGATGATLDGFTISGGFANADSRDVVGAGMYNESSSPLVRNCIFTNNFASAGAGMYNLSSSPTVTSCTFTKNTVEFGYGGGMYNDTSAPVITGCSFTSNAADDAGGGMYNINSSPTVSNSTFSNNLASQMGGGMFNSNSSPALTNCAFTGNTAYLGGGIYNLSSSPAVTNGIFASNYVDGGGQVVNDNASGGAMYNDASSPMLTNCTFEGNTASYSGGAINNANSSAPTVTNSILWGDVTGSNVSEIVDSDSSSSSVLSHSIVQGGYGSDASTISADPLFVDASSGDLHLLPGSPAIDAGNGCASAVTLADQAGNSRWDIASVPNTTNGLDIGALEFQGTAGTDALIIVLDCP